MAARAAPADPPARANRFAPIRVMIVDDSIVARAVLARMLDIQPDFEVVAQAKSGREALAWLGRIEVDLILLDLEMPEMGGLEALPPLMERGAGAAIVVVSSACREGAETGLHALRLGAVDTILKPRAGDLAGEFARSLVERLRRIAPTPGRFERPVALAPVEPAAVPEPASGEAIECVAIGASTGGVPALAAFLGAYPADMAMPLLLTQHLPPPFIPFYADQLRETTGRTVKVAVDGLALDPGMLIIAPGDAHLGLIRVRGRVHVKLERRAASSGCMPSVDTMLAAVARIYGASGLGVVLSGMGRDGAEGARLLSDAGGEVVAQDMASSVIWGMPGAVASAGLAAAVLPPAELAAYVGRRARPVETPSWK